MRFLFIALLMPLIMPTGAWACSEAGPKEFEIPLRLQKACAKDASLYARRFLEAIDAIQRKTPGGDEPRGGFKIEYATLTSAEKGRHNSPAIQFNVGLISKNDWQCNICVFMDLSDNRCYLRTIVKHMCAK